ncbi:MAG: ester cyclase [Gemmatimonadota bacterium]
MFRQCLYISFSAYVMTIVRKTNALASDLQRRIRPQLLGLLMPLVVATACGPAPSAESAVGTAAASAPTAQLEANKVIVRRFWDALNTGDPAAADSLMSPEYRHHAPVSDTGWVAHDWAFYKRGFTQSQKAFPDAQFSLTRVVAEGEYVTVMVSARGTHRGSYGGEAPTGRVLQLPIMAMYHVRDGRILADWELSDSGPVSRLLQGGAPPAKGP